MTEAARLFGTEPYMTEAAYRAAISSGRIREEDIDAVLAAEGGEEPLTGKVTLRALRRAMLLPGVRCFSAESIHWEIEDGGLLDSFRRDLPPAAASALALDSPADLFRFCHSHLPDLPAASGRDPVRPRDGVLASRGVDLDDVINPLLIKLSSVFLDQGLAYWPMPGREHGFFRATLAVLSQPFAMEAFTLRRLPEYLAKVRPLQGDDALLLFLEELGVAESEWERVLLAELLALPGWAGLMRQLELNPSLAPHERVPASLQDFLAVRLLLTTAATAAIAGTPRDWRHREQPTENRAALRLARAAAIFDAMQLAGLSSRVLASRPTGDVLRLFKAVESFGGWERRRILHLAYERRHERQILLPLQLHRASGPSPAPRRVAAQVFFCIDEREESIRRHLEETDPEIETLGAAGFFGVAINYMGIDDAHGVPLCPVVVTPRHAIREQPSEGHADAYERRRSLRRLWASAVWSWFVSSRTLFRGWISTTVLGLFTIFPLAARVFTPRGYARLVKWLNDGILPEPRTELAFMREDRAGHDATEGLLAGFTTEEGVNCVAAVLGPAGLKKDLARLVVVLGHGSTSLNNPHESAHDCGACGGRRGGPNARLFAAVANRPEVRAGLRARGILIPEDTWFVGGYHDTCSDEIDLYDLDAVPATHRASLARVRDSLDRARAWSAHERCRRFEAARWGLTPAGGLHHVEERAEHLAEPRPEYGHCTNSVCIVGRRSTTRGLFLDRRAFLVSYDAAQDPDNKSLAAILGAVIPVCGGISLEYYFSFVDNEGYGCGTKLPHNVTGLVGVMNGYESDLRTGLPWQMVEVHEPVRILFVVETTPGRLLEVVRANPLLWEFVSNRWIRLAAMDPDGGPIMAYRDGVWEAVEGGDETLPEAPSSSAWYQRKRDHLPVARIRGSAEPAVCANEAV